MEIHKIDSRAMDLASKPSTALFMSSACKNLTLPQSKPRCDPGFVFDAISGWCYKVLEDKSNFWRSLDLCSGLDSALPEFRNDSEARGFVNLLNKGKFL
jgi:hypothetical protein